MDDIDHEQRFFEPGISPTSIGHYFRNPRHFWNNSSYNPDRQKTPPTKEMIFGRMVHCKLLTPELFDKGFCVLPERKDYEKAYRIVDTVEEMKVVLKEKELPVSGKRDDLIERLKLADPNILVWSEYLSQAKKDAGRADIVTQAEYESACNMVDAALANHSVRKLLGNGCAEESLTWYREEGGPLCKARLDYLRDGLWVDYKTSVSADNGHIDLDDSQVDTSFVGLSKVLGNFGYHRQAAWGMDGVLRVRGELPRGAVIIAQEKGDDCENVSVSFISPKALDIGKREVEWAYRKIKQRLELWRSLPDEEKYLAWASYSERLREIDLPRYYRSPALQQGE